MKTVSYTVSDTDRSKIQSIQQSYFSSLNIAYNQFPERFGKTPINELRAMWRHNGTLTALYHVLADDGLVEIRRERDELFTFADYGRDDFDPRVNTDIDPDELKRQERKARAQFQRLGAWIYTLFVAGHEQPEFSVGGLVGNNFFETSHATEFYAEAIDVLKLSHPEYIADLLQAAAWA